MKKTLKIIMIMVFLISMLVITNTVEAASATITGNTTVTVGETVKVTVNVTAGAWNLSVNGGGLSTSDSTSLVGQTDKASNTSTSKTISFATSKAGTYTIKLTGDITDFDDTFSNVSKSITVTVKEKETSGGNSGGNSNNGNSGGNTQTPVEGKLTYLKVGSKVWNNPSNYESVTVNASVTSVKITTKTNTGEAVTISSKNGTGSPVKLEEGTNTITIKLASGKTYTVKVVRSAKQEEVPPNVMDEKPKEEEKILLNSLTVEGYELNPTFSPEVYTYKIETEIPQDITKLDIKGVANIEGATIDIQGNDALVEGENVINIIVKNADGSKTATYQIIVNKAAKDNTVVAISSVEIPQQVTSPRWNTTQKVLITVFTSIIAMMGIAFAVIEYRDTKKKQENKEETIEEFEENPYGKLGFQTEEEQDEKIENTEKTEQDDIPTGETQEVEPKGKNKGKHF